MGEGKRLTAVRTEDILRYHVHFWKKACSWWMGTTTKLSEGEEEEGDGKGEESGTWHDS